MKVMHDWNEIIRVEGVTLDLPAELVHECGPENVRSTVGTLLMVSDLLNRVIIEEYGEPWFDDVMNKAVDALIAGRLTE